MASNSRLNKAAQIQDSDVTTLGDKWATVKSQSGDDAYTVDLSGNPSCTCPDHTYRGTTCKHLAKAAEQLGVIDLPEQ